jgi:acyl-CoA synthetase (AMP-forming)/AMP-acid ligase II
MHADIPATIPRVLTRAASLFGEAPAIIEDHRRLSFRELAAAAGSATAAFMAAGIKPGERVAIWAPNSAEWVVAALGALGCGAILVPLNTRLKGKEAAFILRRSGARVLVTVAEFLGTHYPQLIAGEDLPQLETLVGLAARGPHLAGVPRRRQRRHSRGGERGAGARRARGRGRHPLHLRNNG